MGCIKHKQLKEAGKQEYDRLLALVKEGKTEDEVGGIADLAAGLEMARHIWNGDFGKVKEVTTQPISSGFIAELNRNNPKVGKTKVKVLRGTTDGTKVTYIVTYPKSTKEYPIDGLLIAAKDVDPVNSVIYNNEPSENTEGVYETKIAPENIYSVEAMTKLFDELNELDAVKTDPTHLAELKKLLTDIVSHPLKALPEIAVAINTAAKRNGGSFSRTNGIKVKVNTLKAANTSEMSAAEVFVHELTHAATDFAITELSHSAPQALTQLKRLRAQAMKVLTVEDLLPEVVTDRKEELILAKKRWDYMFTSKYGLTEFLAYALTNKATRKKLNTIKVARYKGKPSTFIEHIQHWASKLVNLAVDTWKGKTGEHSLTDGVHDVFSALMEAQGRAKEIRDSNIRERFTDFLDASDDYVSDKLSKLNLKSEDVVDKSYSDTDSTPRKMLWAANALFQVLTNKKYAGTLERVLSTLGMKPEGWVQRTMATMKKEDTYAAKVHSLALAALQIEQTREITAKNVAALAARMFKGPLTPNQRKTLEVALLRTDATLVLSDRDNLELYLDDKKLQDKIAEVESNLHKLHSEEDNRWFDFQIAGLVEYMKTGRGTEVQLRNATAIAAKLGTAKASIEQLDFPLISLIDTLVSLKAIQDTDTTAKEELRELIKEDPEGVVQYSRLQEGLKAHLQGVESPLAMLNRRKGHIRDTYDKTISSTIAPLKDAEKLRKDGFVLVEKFLLSKYDLTREPMGLYISNSSQKQAYDKQALRILGKNQLGRTLYENALKTGKEDIGGLVKESIALAAKSTRALNEAIRKGNTFTLTEGITPEFSHTGRITEYRHDVTLTHKRHLGIEEDGVVTIGRGYAHQVDVEESENHNSIVWEEMLLDLANKDSTDRHLNKEYIALELNSDNDILKEVSQLMPKSLRDAIKELGILGDKKGVLPDSVAKILLGDGWNTLTDKQKTQFKQNVIAGKMYVRRDMLLPLFGFRNITIADTKLLKKLHPGIRRLISTIEGWWKEVVSLYKIDVVIKTLPIIVKNIIGNALYSVFTGGSISEVLKDTIDAWKELTDYIKLRDRLIVVTAEYYKNPSDALLSERDRIVNDLENSFINPLIKAGLFTQIVEEADVLNYKSSNRITNAIDKGLEKAPEVIRNGVDFMYVTEKSSLFQLVSHATAKSDFAARYAQFRINKRRRIRRLEKEQGRALTPKEIKDIEQATILDIREAFVSYTSPDAAWLQWLNDMGFVMFTKYALRMQKVFVDFVTGHPIRATVALLGQEITDSTLGWEPDTITENSMITSGVDFYSPGVMKILENLVVPQMVTNVRTIL